MDYKEKLIKWNATQKYLSELDFLFSLLRIDMSYSSHPEILDFGAGCGKAMDFFNCSGYDVNNYYDGDSELYSNFLPEHYINQIYMNHVIAHIPNPIEVLKDLKDRYNATITIITPNAYWLMLQSNNSYKPDETVVKHYTQTQLRELFEEAGYTVTLCGQFGEETTGVNERLFLQAI